MIVCPVCEHPQDKGDACDVCGKQLVAAAAKAEPVAAMPELEQTAVVSRNAVGPPVAPMPELEVHRVGNVKVADEKVADLEGTAIAGAAAAAALPVEAAPDIERTQLANDQARTVLGDTLQCRYCGHVQKRTNRLCERCANAMPVLAVAKAERTAPVVRVRCPACGESAVPGQKCDACGYFLRTGDER